MSENTEVMAVEETAAASVAPEAEGSAAAEVEQHNASETIDANSDVASSDITSDDIANNNITSSDVASSDTTSNDATSSDADSENFSQDLDPNSEEAGRVVRMLSVGQPVKGTIKRVSDFGAFVDIGVGRDGLVHISELSVKRVGKVSDVLKQGDEVTLWIKKLDRERNRISLTMIEPGTKTMRDLEKGDVVQGTVTRMMPYGAFVDLGVGRDALLHVREMGERFVAKPEDVVTVGEVIEARIIEISRRRSRIDLSMKGLRPEPEPEPVPTPEPVAAPEPEPVRAEAEDKFANMEVMSPIELALRRAMESSGKTIEITKSNKPLKKNTNSRSRARAMQEEIIARTLGKQ